MNQFIYLDNDIVNSIIAQEQKGLTKDIKTENDSVSNQSESNSIGTNIEGKAGGSVIKLASLEAKLNTDARFEKEKGISNTRKEIIEKTIHDASFEWAYNYINAKRIEIGDSSMDEYGKYIELERAFDFVDLDYLEGVFSKDGLLDFMKKSTGEEIKKNVSSLEMNLNRKQRRENANIIEASVQKEINAKNKEFDSVSEILKAFKKLLPYNRMLISSDGYLIPLDEKYFRVNPTSVGFMYGGSVTCVGMITNIIGKDSSPEDTNNVFATLQFSVNEMLRSILPTKEENICVIHPIAIYYKN